MCALTADQLELLDRARDGLPMWGGSVATERLRREVDLLFALGLIERAEDRSSYIPTPVGFRVLCAQDWPRAKPLDEANCGLNGQENCDHG